jgi:16S rRNA G966 N2-methylase RsmD
MRPAGQAKAGFYPTPDVVVQRILPFIRKAEENPVRLLDPCCGTGDPLAVLSRHVGGAGYGIELNRIRADAAGKQLAEVLQTDALSARISPGAFSLLFLNPPYDRDGVRRLEHRFLAQATPWLAPSGVLIYIIPQHQYRPSTLKFITAWYEEIRLYRFPGESFRRFKQTVLFGRKRLRAVQDPPRLKDLTQAVERTLPELPETNDGIYDLPPSPREFLFRPAEVTPEEALPEIPTQGAWLLQELSENIDPPREQAMARPLLPLRQGHIAQMIAAGFVNNRILEKEGERFLIEGQTLKVIKPVESDDPETTIRRDVILTAISAIDEKGNLFEIGEGASDLPSQNAKDASENTDEIDPLPEEASIGEGSADPPAKNRAPATRRRILLEE